MALKGKTALITGSTSGIGLGIAEGFAVQGTNLILNGFGDAGEIEQLRRRLETKFGVTVLYDGADMSKPDQVDAMVRRGVERFGAIDVLVNNAGIQHVAPIDDFPVAKWDAILAINLSSNFHAIRAALPAMKNAAGAGSSTSPPHTRWLPRHISRRTSRPSMAWRA